MSRKKVFIKNFWVSAGISFLIFPITAPFTIILFIADRFKSITKDEPTIFDFKFVQLKENWDSNRILASLGRQRGIYYIGWAWITFVFFPVWVFLAVRYIKKVSAVLGKTQDELTDEEFALWIRIINKVEITDTLAVENLNKKLATINLN